jgi:hypothetical protein
MATESSPNTMQMPDSVDGIVGYFQTHHTIDNLDTVTWLRWVIVILLGLIIAFWHQKQNRTFHEYIRNKNKRTPISDRLSQLAYNRSFEIISLFFILIMCIIYYDTRINAMENTITQIRAQMLAAQDEIATYEAQMALKDQQVQQAIRLSGMDESQQQELDTLKQEFEGLFINYYVLKKCGLSTTQDFHIMNSALMYRLNGLNAPSGVRQNILDAANGSFQELYAEQECKDETLGAMQDDIRNYLREVIENLPDR